MTPNSEQFNLGTPAGRSKIKKSLAMFGCLRAATVDKNGVPLCGGAALKAAEELGMKKQCIEIDKDTMLVVKRPDLDATTQTGQLASIAENLCQEKNLNWNCCLISQKQDLVRQVLAEFEGYSCVTPLVDLEPFFQSHLDISQQLELL